MNWVLAAADAALVLASLLLAVHLRFSEDLIPAKYLGPKVLMVHLAIVAVNLVVYWAMGLYRRVWRYAGVHELKTIVAAVSLSYAPFVVLSAATGGSMYSRGIIIIAWIFTMMLVGALRFTLRLSSEPMVPPHVPGARKILIVGANDAGEATLRELRRQPSGSYDVVGFVDPNPSGVGMRIRGTPVLGVLEDIPRLVSERGVDEIITAIPDPAVVRRLISLCESARHIELKLVPSLPDVVEGRTTVSQIREVRIEDLLEREPVQLDIQSIASFIEGRRVLVTGAGGSIGSEICRQVSRLGPSQLILLGRGENSIHEMMVELRSRSTVPLTPVIADVRDVTRLERIFAETRPQVIFHAAAHKHVPLMEANPEEAMTVNVLGTRGLVELSPRHGVERFILLSTDKAVNPTSVMGASKRLAELIVRDAARASSGTLFVAVRFGNVLGSRGSVIPTFRRQIALGGPVTVTDPEMTRFFMTIPEAVALVIQAAALAAGGEIFVLDMGEPVRILDLARNMIRLSGYEPETDIPIEVLGARPGEKMFEELVGADEEARPTSVGKIQKIVAREEALASRAPLPQALGQIEACVREGDLTRLREVLGLACGTAVL
ncbi:MAG: polysaccharide biosynthesis protein [Armatimonadetes bacterium]|nr:polysaccharide biosynthesis protein [Armatimonadota bacterium]